MSLSVRIKKQLGSFLLDISFESGNGVLGLLGPSGSGKSMTLKCIAGLVKPDSGRIVLNDRVLYDSEAGICLPAKDRRTGYLFQSYALFPHMTVRQNVLCGMGRGKTKTEQEEAFKALVKRFRLEGLENRYPEGLSGGQKQRTALARIFAGEPELLLLDEPFSALDSGLKEELMREMKLLLREYGKNAVFVTHNGIEAFRMTEQMLLLSEGKISASGTTAELFKDPDCAGKLLPGGAVYTEEESDGQIVRAVHIFL